MPRAFLVKKPCVSTCKRNWSELPDEERGEIYVPGEARAPASPPPSSVRPRRGGRRAGRSGASPAARGAGAPDVMFKRPQPVSPWHRGRGGQGRRKEMLDGGGGGGGGESSSQAPRPAW